MRDDDTTRIGKEQDDGDHRGSPRRVPHHFGTDSFAKMKFKIPPYNGKYDPTAYLDWEIEVEQLFSYHDIFASSQVQTIISELTNFSLMWWCDYKQRHPSSIPTMRDQLKAAMRLRFVHTFLLCARIVKKCNVFSNVPSL
jgi:hypothetical protein